jgi:predicted O-methyltransferase YrrM
MSDIVTMVSGDAFAAIPKIEGEFDFVFLDAWKRDYKRFLDMVMPRMRPHGLFLAHNVVNKQARDARLPHRDSQRSAAADDHRQALRRRHVGVV